MKEIESQPLRGRQFMKAITIPSFRGELIKKKLEVLCHSTVFIYTMTSSSSLWDFFTTSVTGSRCSRVIYLGNITQFYTKRGVYLLQGIYSYGEKNNLVHFYMVIRRELCVIYFMKSILGI